VKVNPKRVYRSRMNPDGTHRLCAGCSEGKAEDDNTRWIPVEQFYKRSNGYYQTKCKACSRTAAKERYLSAEGAKDRAKQNERYHTRGKGGKMSKAARQKYLYKQKKHKTLLYLLTVPNPRTGEKRYYVGKTDCLHKRVLMHRSQITNGTGQGAFKRMYEQGFTRITHPEAYQFIPNELKLRSEVQAINYYREKYGDHLMNIARGSYDHVARYDDPTLHRLFFMYCNPRKNKKYKF